MLKKLLNLAAVACCAFALTSCLGDEENTTNPEQVINVTEGLFVLNEGNMSSMIPGSLSYLSYSTWTVQNGLFQSTNGRTLGSTPNSILLIGTNIFIAVTDENRVEITDGSLRSLTAVSMKQPREMATDGKSVFVTNYEGVVTKIDIASRQIVGQSPVIGDNLEGICLANNTLYVCNTYNDDYTYNNTVIKLDPETLSKKGEVTVATNPVEVKASDKKVYVLSSGDYVSVNSQLQEIDENDNVKYVCDATLFDIYKGDLYVANSVTSWETKTTVNDYYVVKNGTREQLRLLCDVDYPCGLAVDPNTGLVFISSYKKGSAGYQDYSAAGVLYGFNFSTSKFMKFDVGVGPTTLCFIKVSYVAY